jgi:predicted SnoaL-like aldol condensation-catalyzing enzyme
MSDENGTLKTIAENFLKLAASGEVDAAYAKYVAQEFIHHNQYYAGDRASLRAGMQESALKFPGKALEVMAALQEGDRVVTYSHVKTGSGGMEIAVFHMFRFSGGKIVELWDVGQPIAQDTPNQNGLF